MRANIFVFFLILLLSGCGGGSSGSNGPDPFNPDPDPVIGLSLAILDSDCNAVSENTFSNDESICVQATLTSDGSASSGEVVSFSVNNTIGTLSANTALTDASGIAQITIAGIDGTTGAATLTATFGDTTVSRSFEFTARTPVVPDALTIAVLDATCQAVMEPKFTTDESICVRATLSQAGEALSGALVNFSLSSSIGTLNVNSALTDSQGLAEVVISNNAGSLGASSVSATFDSLSTSGNFEYVSGAPIQQTNLSLAVLDSNCSATSQPSFSIDESICVRSLLTVDGIPQSGEIINFSVSGGVGLLSSATALTDATGLAEVSISTNNSSLGAGTVTATFDAESASGNFEYASVPPSEVQTLSISVLDANCLRVNDAVFTTEESICVSATLLSGGSPVRGEVVNFAINSSIGTLDNSTALTNASGIARVQIFNSNAATGATSVTASFADLATSGNYEYVPSNQTANDPVIVIELIANGVATNTFNTGENVAVRATFLDDARAAISDAIISFFVNDENITITPATALTNTTGTASSTLIAGDSAIGAFSLTASGTASGVTTEATFNFQVTAAEPEPITTQLAINLLDATCTTALQSFETAETICVQAVLSTIDNQPVANQIVSFSLADDLGTLSAPNALTNSDGVAQVTITSANSALGASSVTASFDSLNVSSNFEYTQDIPVEFSIALQVLDAACNTRSQPSFTTDETICVRAALTADGAIQAGEIIGFSLSNSVAALSGASSLTDENGIAEIILSNNNGTLGASVVSATFGDVSSSANFEYTTVPVSNVQTLSVMVLDASCNAVVESVFTTNETICVQATLLTDGSASNGEVINFAINSSIGSLNNTTALTNANGIAEVEITNNDGATGATSITASINDISASANFEYEPDPNANTNTPIIVVELINSNGAVNEFAAGESVAIRATLLDEDRTAVQGEIISFSVNNSDISVSPTTALTSITGTAASNMLAGTTVEGAFVLSATATLNDTPISTDFNFSVLPAVAEPAENQLSIAIFNSDCSTAASSFVNSENICVRATLENSSGDPVSNEIVSFALQDSSVSLNAQSVLTNSSGIAEVTILNSNAVVGANVVSASFGELSVSSNFEYVTGTTPSPDISLELIANGVTTNEIETGDTAAIRATLQDENGTAIEGEIITFSVNNSDITITPATALTESTGTASSSLIAADTAIGAFVLTATANVNNETVTGTYNFQVSEATTVSDNQLSIAILNASCVADDQSFGTNENICIQATLQTNEDTPVPVANEIVSFSLSTGLGSLSATSALTNSSGIAQVTVSNSDASVGAATVTATYNTLSQSANYEYVAVEDSNTPVPSINVDLRLSTDTDSVINTFQAGNEVVVRATVLDANDEAVENAIVTYSLQGSGPVLSPPTALTNSSGVSEIAMTATDADLGAYALQVTTTVDTIEISNSVNFEVQASGTIEGTIRAGTFDNNGDFFEGVVGSDLADAGEDVIVSAGATIGFTVTLIDETDALLTTPTTVSFTSNCVENNEATIDTSVTSINGVASATFEDLSCAGSTGITDQIVASVVINNTTTTLTRSLNISAEEIGSISFVSASPTSLVLAGTGGQGNESVSNLTFQVNGALGNPLSQQTVDFSLNTNIGGLSLEPTQGLTNSNGQVSTRVTAGTIPTPVRVTASVTVEDDGDNTTIETQSDLLTVNTGLPDQNSFTIGASTLNVEGASINGNTSTITVRLADSFNNPVPNGTTVNFTAEYGTIGGSCQTGADANGVIDPDAENTGTCSVTWTSSDPRDSFDHRATILATAIGHETLIDANGNNAYDGADIDGDAIDDDTDNGFSVSRRTEAGFIDLTEAWRDDNEDGDYQSNEPFFDFNADGEYSEGDGVFNGPQCNAASCENAASSINIRRAIRLIVSSSNAHYRVYVGLETATPADVLEDGDNVFLSNDPAIVNNTSFPNSLDGVYSLGGATVIPYLVLYSDESADTFADGYDPNAAEPGVGEVLPSGTQVGILDSEGNISTLLFTVNNTSRGLNSFGLPGDIIPLDSVSTAEGDFSIAIDTPSGSRTTVTFNFVD